MPLLLSLLHSRIRNTVITGGCYFFLIGGCKVTVHRGEGCLNQQRLMVPLLLPLFQSKGSSTSCRGDIAGCTEERAIEISRG